MQPAREMEVHSNMTENALLGTFGAAAKLDVCDFSEMLTESCQVQAGASEGPYTVDLGANDLVISQAPSSTDASNFNLTLGLKRGKAEAKALTLEGIDGNDIRVDGLQHYGSPALEFIELLVMKNSHVQNLHLTTVSSLQVSNVACAQLSVGRGHNVSLNAVRFEPLNSQTVSLCETTQSPYISAFILTDLHISNTDLPLCGGGVFSLTAVMHVIFDGVTFFGDESNALIDAHKVMWQDGIDLVFKGAEPNMPKTLVSDYGALYTNVYVPDVHSEKQCAEIQQAHSGAHVHCGTLPSGSTDNAMADTPQKGASGLPTWGIVLVACVAGLGLIAVVCLGVVATVRRRHTGQPATIVASSSATKTATAADHASL